MFKKLSRALDILWIIAIGLVIVSYQNCAPPKANSGEAAPQDIGPPNESATYQEENDFYGDFEPMNVGYGDLMDSSSSSQGARLVSNNDRTGSTGNGDSVSGGTGGGTGGGIGGYRGCHRGLFTVPQYKINNAGSAVRRNNLPWEVMVPNTFSRTRKITFPRAMPNDVHQVSCQAAYMSYGYYSGPARGLYYNVPSNCRRLSGVVSFQCKGRSGSIRETWKFTGQNCACTLYHEPGNNGGGR